MKKFLIIFIAAAILFAFAAPAFADDAPVPLAEDTVEIHVASDTQLISALLYAAGLQNVRFIDIHIRGDIKLPEDDTYKITDNVFLYIDEGFQLDINGSHIILENYGTLIIDGTINVTNNVINMGSGIAFLGENGKVLGNAEFIRHSLVTNFMVVFDTRQGYIIIDGVKSTRIAVAVPKSQPKVASPGTPVTDIISQYFMGWYDEITGGTLWDFNNDVTKSMYLYAQYGSIYTVEHLSTSGKLLKEEILAGYYDTKATAVPLTFDGYTFDEDNAGNVKEGIISPAGTLVLKLYYTPTSYNINYILDGGTNHPDNPATYTIESPTITLKDPTKNGFTFKEWTPDNGIITEGSTNDKTFTAHWIPIEYTITYILGGGTNHPDNPATYTIVDTPITLKAPSLYGHDFVEWTPNNGVIAEGETGNKTFTAAWKPIEGLEYVVNYLEKDTNKVLATQKKVEDQVFGTSATENAIDIPGYAKEAPTTVTIVIDLTNNVINFFYTIETYTITYILDGGTNHPDNPATYTIVDTPITLKAPTKYGHDFVGWSPDNGVIAEGSTGNKTFTAAWKPVEGLVYVVNYLEKDTDKVLATQKKVEDQVFGTSATETAIDIYGYDKVLPTTATITIGVTDNVINFYYTAKVLDLVFDDVIGDDPVYAGVEVTPGPDDSERASRKVIFDAPFGGVFPDLDAVLEGFEFEFLGWTLEEGGAVLVTPSDIVKTEGTGGTITLYAKWDIRIVEDEFLWVYVEHDVAQKKTNLEVEAGSIYTLNVKLLAEQDALYLNYTQVIAWVSYNSDLFEFVEFVKLAQIASELRHPTTDTFSVRTAPTVNMFIGASCKEPVLLAQLHFKLKDDAPAGAIAKFVVDNASVYPTALVGTGGIKTAPGNTISVTVK